MDGVLLIDKPTGPTSHDVVARLRQVLHVRAIGHTGTLDPLASGLLPLVARARDTIGFASDGADKTYEATVRLGWATDTDDAEGAPARSGHADPSVRRRRRACACGVPRHVRPGAPSSLRQTRGRRQGLRPGAPAPGRGAGARSRDGQRARLAWRVRATSLTLRLRVSSGFYVQSPREGLGRRARLWRARLGAAPNGERRIPRRRRDPAGRRPNGSVRPWQPGFSLRSAALPGLPACV